MPVFEPVIIRNQLDTERLANHIMQNSRAKY